MTTLKFKTNINCGNCIRTVTPFLEELDGLNRWAVDTTTSDKVLTVETTSISADSIIEAVEEAGFDIVQI